VISPAARQGVLATNRCAPSGATWLPPWDRARSRARPRSSAGFAERDYSGTQAVKALREESELDRPARGCPELEGVSHWVGTPETGRINRGHRHAALRIGLGVERDHSRRARVGLRVEHEQVDAHRTLREHAEIDAAWPHGGPSGAQLPGELSALTRSRYLAVTSTSPRSHRTLCWRARATMCWASSTMASRWD
jgi:hypothetical protein